MVTLATFAHERRRAVIRPPFSITSMFSMGSKGGVVQFSLPVGAKSWHLYNHAACSFEQRVHLRNALLQSTWAATVLRQTRSHGGSPGDAGPGLTCLWPIGPASYLCRVLFFQVALFSRLGVDQIMDAICTALGAFLLASGLSPSRTCPSCRIFIREVSPPFRVVCA